MTTLAKLSPGQSARITGIEASPAIRQRMLDMGLIPETRIRLERVGPAGHPLWIACQGAQLALRLGEASGVIVDDVAAAPRSSCNS